MSNNILLPSWLDHEAATLAGAVPPGNTLASALPAFTRALSLSPLERLRIIQQSGLSECGGSGEPIHLAWRQFIRGHGSSVLVIDATLLDVHSLGTATVLEKAPWLLAEGVMIAIGMRDSEKIELLLPVSLNGLEAAFLNAVDSIRTLAEISAPGRKIEVIRNSNPVCLSEGRPSDKTRLVHSPETWCRIALLFSDIPDINASLLTLRQGLNERGLVELSRSVNLKSQIDIWRGGEDAGGLNPVLVFDDGLGGFLPLSKSDISSDPLSLNSAGLIPSPSSLMVITGDVCMVRQTRRALYRHWQLSEEEDAHVRSLLARAARLVTEITIGLGNMGHLAALDSLAASLETQGLAAAWPLVSSLRYFHEQWESHARTDIMS